MVRHMLRKRHLLLFSWNWIAVASWWHKAFCSILYLWKYCCLSQYLLFNGPREAAQEDVRNDAVAGDDCYDLVFGTYPVCCSLVAQEGTGLIILHIAVLVADLVQSLLHPVRTGCSN